MAIDTNNIHVEEFIKENRVDGVTTTLTIKLVAYDLDTIVEYVGDGNYLNHNDNSWQDKTIVGRIYHDFDVSPSEVLYFLLFFRHYATSKSKNIIVKHLIEMKFVASRQDGVKAYICMKLFDHNARQLA